MTFKAINSVRYEFKLKRNYFSWDRPARNSAKFHKALSFKSFKEKFLNGLTSFLNSKAFNVFAISILEQSKSFPFSTSFHYESVCFTTEHARVIKNTLRHNRAMSECWEPFLRKHVRRRNNRASVRLLIMSAWVKLTKAEKDLISKFNSRENLKSQKLPANRN